MPETIYEIDGSRAVDKLSKTKRKQQMLELQDLGEELVELSKDALKKIPMSDELREAIKEYQRIPTHGAHRRQLQFIGKIMRSEDTTPIVEKLKQLKGSSTAATALLHRIERYRNEMIAKDEAITQFLSDFPSVDAQPLRALVRNARKEAEQSKPPKAYRELFQLIKSALEPSMNQDEADDETAQTDFGDE
ncbi:MAG: DUF615 domain-containing protein [Burkholderiales bacterium]|nr:DUF615 domain-containing protein [Burkholderiales bacterium]MCE1177212.1 DUF615 domain-containing protein [Burkholderiales bacterium]